MAPAPPLRWLLVKSRSRDGSFGFFSWSLSELSLELSWRGGILARRARGGWLLASGPGGWLAARGASFVPGALSAGAATSQEVRAAAPGVAYCVAAQNWRRQAQNCPPAAQRPRTRTLGT